MKIFYFLLVTTFTASVSDAQISIYLRLIDYNNVNVFSSISKFNNNPNAIPTDKNDHTDEAAIETFADGDEQTLNIGSQSTGSGAGKISFGPITFTKPIDVNSPKFFEMMASGTPYQWAEFSFYRHSAPGSSDVLLYKIRLGLAAFKSIQRAAATCTGDCPTIVENFTMEAGAKYISFFGQKPDGSNNPGAGAGWNRVKNVSWNGSLQIK